MDQYIYIYIYIYGSYLCWLDLFLRQSANIHKVILLIHEIYPVAKIFGGVYW